MAITAQTKILTLDYWKPASQLEVGDYVFDQKGNLVRVTLVQQYQGIECFEVTFNDHLSLTGDSHLTFLTENLKYRNRLTSYKGKLQFRRPLRPLSADQLHNTPLLDHRNRKTLSVPTANPLQLPHKDLPVPPFVFGFWFFARRSTGTLAAARNCTDYVREKFKDYGYRTQLGTILNTGERDFRCEPHISRQLAPNIPTKITNNYLLASQEQRIELLSGIMCSRNRSYNKKDDKFRFTSRNYDQVRRIQLLAESIGCRTSMMHDTSLDNYVVWFKSKVKIHPDQSSPPLKVHYGRRYIAKVTPIASQLCVHIETDGQDGTILAGEGFIPCR